MCGSLSWIMELRLSLYILCIWMCVCNHARKFSVHYVNKRKKKKKELLLHDVIIIKINSSSASQQLCILRGSMSGRVSLQLRYYVSLLYLGTSCTCYFISYFNVQTFVRVSHIKNDINPQTPHYKKKLLIFMSE